MYGSRQIRLALIGAGVAISSLHAIARSELSLDGTWQIAFDLDNSGREAGWHLDGTCEQLENLRAISVPSAWELIEQDYEGVAFYRREFDVPAGWAGKVVRLCFGAVNYIAEVWINNEPIGFHEGGFTPFELRVDRMLKPGGSNVITLRVQGPIILSDKMVDGIGPLETPQWRGGICGGIWQSVKLVATDAAYFKDVHLMPSWRDGTVTLNADLDQTAVTGRKAEVVVRISPAADPDKTIATRREVLHLRPGVTSHSWTVAIQEARAWSPDDPFLYLARISVLLDGEESDAWTHRFGLRAFTIRDKQFLLNGERVYVKATFFEGLYPNGIASPDSEAMARREIQLAKEAGFNMIRPWRRPPDPMWLDLADEMGVLVVGSPVLECMRLPLSTPYLPARVENEIRQSVLRDRSRTCVVQWELFNELHRPILNQMMRPMAMLVRDLDPERLILDESGGWAFGANMYLPGEYEPAQFNDIHDYPGPFISESLYDGYLTIGMTPGEKAAFGYSGRTPGRNVVPGLMSFVSELGYGSLPDLPACNELFEEQGNPLTPAFRYHQRIMQEQIQALKESGFDYLYPDFQQFCLMQQSIHGAANRRMIEAVRSNPRVEGYCIHALCAGDWILGAGLIDIWRNPKSAAYEETKAANQPRIVSIRMFPRNVYARDGARLSVTGINDLAPVPAACSVRILSEAGDVVMEKRLEAGWQSGVSNLLSETFDTNGLRGTCTVEVAVEDKDGNRLAGSGFTFDVFSDDELQVPDARIAILDTQGTLTPFLDRQGISHAAFDRHTPVSVPVFVVDNRAETDAQRARFELLRAFIEAGGTAVYTGALGVEGAPRSRSEYQQEPLPFEVQFERAVGLWTCIPHLVKAHPVFDGLPVDGPMREIYENVWPRQTIIGMGGETVAASIGFKWFSDDHKLHYSGPGESWWGADVAIVPFGRGRCIISQLRLVENVGKDPVADKLMYNLIRFSTH